VTLAPTGALFASLPKLLLLHGHVLHVSAPDTDHDSVAPIAGGLPLRAPPEDYSSDSSSDSTASDGSDNGLRVRPSRARGGRKPKPPSTDLQYCGVRAPCQHCGAMMWPKEGAACCKDGKQALDEVYNPPLDPAYLRILQQPSFSHDSRLINAALAMGSQCTSPSRAQGGVGFHEQHYAHLSLLGTTYLVLRNPHSGNNPFDNYMLPRDLLLETATQDLGADYAARLLSAREYLQAHHPLASRLRPVAEVPAQRLDFSKVIRLEANSSHSGAMELAHVSSGVVGRGHAANRVLYFDLSKHERGLAPTTVSTFNALFEVLQFPLLFETGCGGYHYGKGDDAVQSTTGVRLTLNDYTRAMLYQNLRLQHMGRLAQEYALVQHSRHVQYTLQFQRVPRQAQAQRLKAHLKFMILS